MSSDGAVLLAMDVLSQKKLCQPTLPVDPSELTALPLSGHRDTVTGTLRVSAAQYQAMGSPKVLPVPIQASSSGPTLLGTLTIPSDHSNVMDGARIVAIHKLLSRIPPISIQACPVGVATPQQQDVVFQLRVHAELIKQAGLPSEDKVLLLSGHFDRSDPMVTLCTYAATSDNHRAWLGSAVLLHAHRVLTISAHLSGYPGQLLGDGGLRPTDALDVGGATGLWDHPLAGADTLLQAGDSPCRACTGLVKNANHRQCGNCAAHWHLNCLTSCWTQLPQPWFCPKCTGPAASGSHHVPDRQGQATSSRENGIVHQEAGPSCQHNSFIRHEAGAAELDLVFHVSLRAGALPAEVGGSLKGSKARARDSSGTRRAAIINSSSGRQLRRAFAIVLDGLLRHGEGLFIGPDSDGLLNFCDRSMGSAPPQGIQDVTSLMASVTSSGTEAPMALRPEGVMTLPKPFQLQGLEWLLRREREADVRGGGVVTLHPEWVQLVSRGGAVLHVNRQKLTIQAAFPVAPLGQTCGGFLCDEMGLGKSLQVLMLIAANPPPPGWAQPSNQPLKWSLQDHDPCPIATTLLVAPANLIPQWQDELERHMAPGTLEWGVLEPRAAEDIERETITICMGDLPAIACRGPKDTRVELHRCDVVFMSYELMLSELRQGRSYLKQYGFWRIILDEAQMVANSNSAAAVMASDLWRRHAWVVTGTPISTALDEIRGLMTFLDYEPYCRRAEWGSLVHGPLVRPDTRPEARHAALCALWSLLRGVMLRRTKASVEGQLGLPGCEFVDRTLPLGVLERYVYEDTNRKLVAEFSAPGSQAAQQLQEAVEALSRRPGKGHSTKTSDASAREVSTRAKSLLQLYTRLRQSCCHPQIVVGQEGLFGRGRAASKGLSMHQIFEKIVLKAFNEYQKLAAQVYELRLAKCLLEARQEDDRKKSHVTGGVKVVVKQLTVLQEALPLLVTLAAAGGGQDVAGQAHAMPPGFPSRALPEPAQLLALALAATPGCMLLPCGRIDKLGDGAGPSSRSTSADLQFQPRNVADPQLLSLPLGFHEGLVSNNHGLIRFPRLPTPELESARKRMLIWLELYQFVLSEAVKLLEHQAPANFQQQPDVHQCGTVTGSRHHDSLSQLTHSFSSQLPHAVQAQQGQGGQEERTGGSGGLSASFDSIATWVCDSAAVKNDIPKGRGKKRAWQGGEASKQLPGLGSPMKIQKQGVEQEQRPAHHGCHQEESEPEDAEWAKLGVRLHVNELPRLHAMQQEGQHATYVLYCLLGHIEVPRVMHIRPAHRAALIDCLRQGWLPGQGQQEHDVVVQALKREPGLPSTSHKDFETLEGALQALHGPVAARAATSASSSALKTVQRVAAAIARRWVPDGLSHPVASLLEVLLPRAELTPPQRAMLLLLANVAASKQGVPVLSENERANVLVKLDIRLLAGALTAADELLAVLEPEIEQPEAGNKAQGNPSIGLDAEGTEEDGGMELKGPAAAALQWLQVGRMPPLVALVWTLVRAMLPGWLLVELRDERIRRKKAHDREKEAERKAKEEARLEEAQRRAEERIEQGGVGKRKYAVPTQKGKAIGKEKMEESDEDTADESGGFKGSAGPLEVPQTQLVPPDTTMQGVRGSGSSSHRRTRARVVTPSATTPSVLATLKRLQGLLHQPHHDVKEPHEEDVLCGVLTRIKGHLSSEQWLTLIQAIVEPGQMVQQELGAEGALDMKVAAEEVLRLVEKLAPAEYLELLRKQQAEWLQYLQLRQQAADAARGAVSQAETAANKANRAAGLAAMAAEAACRGGGRAARHDAEREAIKRCMQAQTALAMASQAAQGAEQKAKLAASAAMEVALLAKVPPAVEAHLSCTAVVQNNGGTKSLPSTSTGQDVSGPVPLSAVGAASVAAAAATAVTAALDAALIAAESAISSSSFINSHSVLHPALVALAPHEVLRPVEAKLLTSCIRSANSRWQCEHSQRHHCQTRCEEPQATAMPEEELQGALRVGDGQGSRGGKDCERTVPECGHFSTQADSPSTLKQSQDAIVMDSNDEGTNRHTLEEVDKKTDGAAGKLRQTEAYDCLARPSGESMEHKREMLSVKGLYHRPRSSRMQPQQEAKGQHLARPSVLTLLSQVEKQEAEVARRLEEHVRVWQSDPAETNMKLAKLKDSAKEGYHSLKHHLTRYLELVPRGLTQQSPGGKGGVLEGKGKDPLHGAMNAPGDAWSFERDVGRADAEGDVRMHDEEDSALGGGPGDDSEMTCVICLDHIQHATVTSCGHTFCSICIHELMSAAEEKQKQGSGHCLPGQRGAGGDAILPCPYCRTPLKRKDLFDATAPTQGGAGTSNQKTTEAYPGAQEGTDPMNGSEAGVAMTDEDVDDKVQRYGAKLAELIRDLQRMVADCEPHSKALVFSSWPRLLSLAGEALEAHGIGYAMLAGQPPGQRQVALRQFRTDQSCRVLLMLMTNTTTSGASGLTLTEAKVAFILEPSTNPGVEAQAAARIHRLGQKHSTRVVRLLAADTIEQRVVEMQDHKRRSGQDCTQATLAGDIADLLGMMDAHTSVDPHHHISREDGPSGLCQTAA